MRKQLTLGLGLGVIGVYMAAVAQGPLYDKVIVDLPYPVTINNQRLEPGEYVIREMQSAAKTRVLQIFKDGGTTFETSAMTIPALDNNTPEDTKVVLHKVGDNEYYFDKIWIQGKNYGYEFVLPEEVRNRQKESSTVAGRFVPMNQQQSTTSSTTTPADTAATAGTAAARSTVNDSTTASNQTTTGTSTPGFAQSTENNRFTTSDSADNNSRTTSNDLTAQNRTTGSDVAPQATTPRNTPRSTASDAAAQQSTPRNTPRMTSSDAASQSTTTGANTAGENRSLSGRTMADADQATTTGSRTPGNTLPSTAGNWMALLLCGSALTSLGYAVSRRS